MLRGATAVAEALSPDGTRLFVLDYVGPAAKSETVAYSTATGAQLWATTYPPENTGAQNGTIAISPDGAQVYVTGSAGPRSITIAYSAGTGRQLWVSRYKHNLRGLAVSPDGTTVYEAANGSVLGWGSHLGVIAYDAATGRRRWLRYYTRVNRAAAAFSGAVAVSPDGSTVYVAGETDARSPSSYSILVLAYRATGTLKWVTRYTNRYNGAKYAGGAFSRRISLGPGGSVLYVAGSVTSKAGHQVAATLAFRAATGTCLWQHADSARGGEGGDAVTPDGRTVIAVGDRTYGGYRIASYDARTGATRWARRAPWAQYAGSNESAGLLIDPSGDTAFVASPEYMGGGYFLAAWSVARGNLLWTAHYAASSAFSPIAIAESGDGSRLFLTGSVWRRHGLRSGGGGMTTIAYQK